MKYLLIFLSAIVIVSSCKKENAVRTISASGNVLNEQTGKPIPYIIITLKQSSGSTSVGGSDSWTVIETTTTDGNGTFSFVKEIQNSAAWIVSINDYDSKYFTTWYAVEPDVSSVKTTYLYRNSTLTVTAQTSDPLASGDDFFINLPGVGCRCSDLTTERAKGGAYNKITWSVTRNNVTENFQDSVYCPVDTVQYFIINY
jgi:5-hydroxyisourate hydrolase-like protein (transthyretin family)